MNVFLLLTLICAADPNPTLESRLAPLAKAHEGKVAIAVKHLETGETYYYNADEVMPTASLIKLPVMVETYWQAAEGKVKFDTTITLKKVSVGTEVSIVQEGVPAVIPAEACYLGWQESLTLLAKLVEAEIPD